MADRLAGKVAVVTGAGSGMGRAAAKLYAKEGARVLCADVVSETAEETAGSIRDAGGEAIAFQADVSKWDDVDAMIHLAVETWGRLDIILNNAGILTMNSTMDTTEAELDRIFNVNLKGPLFGSQRAIQQFRAQGGGGVIVNTASIGGLRGGAGGSAYTMSKHAVVGLTRQLAVEVAAEGIRVNAVCPGGVYTGMAERGEGTDQMAKAIVPLGRFGEPEEMAQIMLFLASDESSYVTGHLLVGDGGWTAR